MKFTKCLLVGLMIACGALASMPAMAATSLTISPATLSYPNEGFKPSSYNPFSLTATAGAAQKIIYKPETTTTGDIVFTLTNGIWSAAPAGARYMLYKSGATTEFFGPATLSTNTLKFTGIATTASVNYHLVASGTATAVLNAATLNSATPTPITISVSQGTIFNTASAQLIQFANFWTPYIDVTNGGKSASAVIDVNPPSLRTKFLVDAPTTATSDPITVNFKQPAAYVSTFVTNVWGGTAGLPADLVAGGTGDFNTFSGVTLAIGVDDTTALTSPVPFVYSTASSSLTYNSTTKQYSTTVSSVTIPVNSTAATFTFSVTGTTVINTRPFTIQVNAIGTGGFNDVNYFALGASAGSWTLNGYQALCPYFNTNPSFGSQFILNNSTAQAVSVFWDVTNSTSTTVAANLSAYSNKQITGKATIPANGTALYDAAELIRDLGLPTTEGESYLRNQLRVTVTGAAPSITGMAIQQDGTNGKRTEPLFPTTTNSRTW